MPKKVYHLLCALLFAGGAFAQSEPQFTQYMYNKYLFNPAYAGSQDGFEFGLLHRSQYVGLSEPMISTQGFDFNIPLNSISSGIGL
ncbi:MAG: hypothetical protein JWO06_3913, partial [Bacteroidota bacterium]|nr:hypothetical protein [Bacteroidota bacterium]